MDVSDEPAVVVTITSTVPACAGAVATSEPSLSTVKLLAGMFPNKTLVAPVKPVPETVTTVPPAVLPVGG
jgi:hypothetical protein